MNIRIYYDDTGFRLKNSGKIRKVVNKVIEREKKILGDLNFIFTNDENLRKINSEFLNHDYYTDVITFCYREGDILNGEIYISIDRVRVNSINYKVSLKSELERVIIHGVLHLVGYEDKTESERSVMREMEDEWILLIEGQKDGL